MSYELIPFRAEHLLEFEARDARNFEEAVRNALEKEKKGPAWTGLYNGKVLGSAGIAVLWPGVGEAWMSLSDGVCRHPLWFHRTVRRMLREMKKELGLWRLQAAVKADEERYCWWIELLGFRKESLMLRYGPERADYYRYVILED